MLGSGRTERTNPVWHIYPSLFSCKFQYTGMGDLLDTLVVTDELEEHRVCDV